MEQLNLIQIDDVETSKPKPLAVVPSSKKKKKSESDEPPKKKKTWIQKLSKRDVQLELIPEHEIAKPVPSEEEARERMDSLKLTVDQYTELQRFFTLLTREECLQEARLFLERNAWNDKIFWRNGYHFFSVNIPLEIKPLTDLIIRSRPKNERGQRQSTYAGQDDKHWNTKGIEKSITL